MSKRIPIFLGFLLIFLAAWLLITTNKHVHDLIQRLDNLGYDLQLKTRVLTKHNTPDEHIAIVDINDESLKSEGRWPWPRSKMADLANHLLQQGAVVVAFDMFFPEKQSNIADTVLATLSKKNLMNAAVEEALKQNSALFDEDAIFAKSLASNRSVLALGFLPHDQIQNELPAPILTLTPQDEQELNLIDNPGYLSSIPVLQQAAKLGGFINIIPDGDGIIRRSPMLMQYKNGLYPSLALQAYLGLVGQEITLVTPDYNGVKKLEGIQIGDNMISTDSRSQVLIPFIGRSYTFPYFSASDVLHDKIPEDALLGKIVFVGTSATGLGDLQATAVQNPFPGVEIQATLLNGLLKNNFSYIPAWTFGANLAITILFGLIATLLFPYLGPRTIGFIIVLVPVGLLFLNNWIWEHTGLVLSFLMPVVLTIVLAVLNIVYGYLFETRKREKLNDLFGAYVPAKHIDEMLKSKGGYALTGEDREMSVLFADIRSFTTISEGLSAAELVEMLNTFFTPMTEIIFNHKGTIDKYVGDLIMAFWGAPLEDKDHARNAIESALDMQIKLSQMQAVFAERKWPEIHIGIGVNSGTMSVGDMGSRFRLNYTVLGDNVNLGSRVEGLTKFYGAQIIVTENTQKDQPNFVFRKLDQVRVKGKKKGVPIYEPLCRHSELTEELKKELETYHQALDYYFKQDWENALLLLNQLKQTYPDKKIYSLYMDRIKEFKEHPLPSDWDGVYVHVTK